MSWEITGNAGTNSSTNFLGTTDGQPLVIKTQGVEAMRIFFRDPGGSVTFGGTQSGQSNVALGIDAQSRRSFIQATNTAPNGPGQLVINPEGGQVLIGPPFLGVPSAALTVSPQGLAGLIDGIVIGRPDITSGGFTSLSLSISDISDGHALIQAIKSAGTEWGDLVLNANGGNVGIGTTTPNAKLTVDPQGAGGIFIGNPSITPQQGGGTFLELNISAASGGFANIQATRATFLIEGIPKPAPGVLAINANGGNVGIGTTTPDAKLTVNGDISVTGDVILTGADCAEEFDIAGREEIEPGTVMVIDQDGVLQQSQCAYDKRVAGIVSGAGGYRPGLILDRQRSQDNRIPIALAGKVYCRVDAQYAPIEVGDMLTTSLTMGHAMKAGDPLKAFGSVIGKALSSLDQGRGLIPILVALQ